MTRNAAAVVSARPGKHSRRSNSNIPTYAERHLPLDGGGWEGVRASPDVLCPIVPLPNSPRKAEGADRGWGWLRSAPLILALLIANPVLAGDRALIEFIGFSEDSRYFAFEEFGIQDGSGFAYSSLYIVDLAEDSWVVGTPIRMQADDETATLSQVRAEVQLQAADDIETLGIDVPAELVALVGDGMPDSDAQTLRFGSPGYGPGEVSGNYQLQLSSFPTNATAPCMEWFSVDPLGYELSIVDGANARLLHRDDTLPRSRGCPSAYRLYGVVLPFNAGSISHAVGIVSVYAGGFEGPDRRFIAVPLGL